MIDPKALPEFFLELWTDREGELLSTEPGYTSAEAIALAAYRVGIPHPLNQRRPQFDFELVLTTHGRDATAECTALLKRMHEVARGLAAFDTEYQVLDTLAQNIERLTYCEEHDYPCKLAGFY